MTHYFDTSALIKFVRSEAETTLLRTWAHSRKPVIVTNVIGAVELQRAAARVSAETTEGATHLLARITQIALTPTALQLAAGLPPSTVRTLDALHVASAAELPELVAVVTYDHRMAEAATGYGLPVISPGA